MKPTLLEAIDSAIARNPAAPAFIYQDELLQYQHLRAFIAVANTSGSCFCVNGGKNAGTAPQRVEPIKDVYNSIR